jgi:hypothetical protein
MFEYYESPIINIIKSIFLPILDPINYIYRYKISKMPEIIKYYPIFNNKKNLIYDVSTIAKAKIYINYLNDTLIDKQKYLKKFVKVKAVHNYIPFGMTYQIKSRPYVNSLII